MISNGAIFYMQWKNDYQSLNISFGFVGFKEKLYFLCAVILQPLFIFCKLNVVVGVSGMNLPECL